MRLREFHANLGGVFTEVNGAEVVADYGNVEAEYRAVRTAAGVLDLSFRARLCLTGGDRLRFLHGQVTNDIKALKTGQGCYAALVTAKGKMESDLNIYNLPDELLLDFEPGLAAAVTGRLEKFIVADDIQVVDVSEPYGLLSVQGPKAVPVLQGLEMFEAVPSRALEFVSRSDASLGELYLMNQSRTGTAGFDLFIPAAGLQPVLERLLGAGAGIGTKACGWQALEIARIEAGIPRFGVDMEETHFPQECGIEAHAVSYSKGCYIGQEVLNRIHTMGHVNRQLWALRLSDELPAAPVHGDKLYLEGKEAGQITSAAGIPATGEKVALGYVRTGLDPIRLELELQKSQSQLANAVRAATLVKLARR